jgi:hypothetical protein
LVLFALRSPTPAVDHLRDRSHPATQLAQGRDALGGLVELIAEQRRQHPDERRSPRVQQHGELIRFEAGVAVNVLEPPATAPSFAQHPLELGLTLRFV